MAGGSTWRDAETFAFTSEGDQLIKRQYDQNSGLSAGSGSVVVSAGGKLGAVVQIQARGQTATSGAYSGATAGAAEANVPLVLKGVNTASGLGNSHQQPGYGAQRGLYQRRRNRHDLQLG